MPTAREKLIADWQQGLAAAEGVRASGSQRAAWLARLRIRLYRFLLSLYGDGRWNAPPRAELRNPNDLEHSVVFDAPTVLPLAGKPAKSEGKIRAALKAVANGQDHRPTIGSLTADRLANSWFVVAAQSSKWNVRKCASLLRRAGIKCRVCIRGDDLTVEVPGLLRREAIGLLDLRPADLRQVRRIVKIRSQPTPVSVLILIMVIPVIGYMALLILLSAVDPQALNGLPQAGAFAAAICGAIASFYWGIRRSRHRELLTEPGKPRT